MNRIRMRTMLAVFGVGLMVTTATILASAGHGGPGRHGGPHGGGMMGPGGEGPFAALDLTDAQKEQIKALHDKFQEEHASELEQMKTLHEQMRSQMESGDQEGATATREKLDQLRESLHDDHEALRLQMEEILTDAQKAKLQEMHAKGKGDCKGGGRCPGPKGEKSEGEGTGSAKPGLN